MKRFPADFIWGGGISATQFEGAYDIDGRGMSLNDVATEGNPRKVTWVDKFGSPHASDAFSFSLPSQAQYAVLPEYDYPYHEGADFYHHWQEDIALLQELGIKAFRLSISWSRLFPKGIETEPNPAGVTFYRDVLEALKAAGIEPIVCLWHEDTPLYLEEKLGGWDSRETVEHFERYAKTCFRLYRNLVTRWITFSALNEPILFLDREQKKFPDATWQSHYIRQHHMLLANALATKAAHKANPENKIGPVLKMEPVFPGKPDTYEAIQARKALQRRLLYTGDAALKGAYPSFAPTHWKEHHVIMDISEEDREILASVEPDCYGIAYYRTADTLGNRKEWDADGLFYSLMLADDRYHMPVVIAENGWDGPDEERIEYLKEHIQKAADAIQEGIPLVGYLVWSLFDQVSNTTGSRNKRYGLVHVDYEKGGTRTPKPSFDWYRTVIATNGETL